MEIVKENGLSAMVAGEGKILYNSATDVYAEKVYYTRGDKVTQWVEVVKADINLTDEDLKDRFIQDIKDSIEVIREDRPVTTKPITTNYSYDALNHQIRVSYTVASAKLTS